MANHSSGNVQSAPDINDYAEMFELAPVSLWLEDYSALKALFAAWRAEGVTDLRAYFAADTARVRQCSACIRLIKVNRTTLTLYEAKDAGHLIANLGLVLRDDMLTTHVDELVQLWEGKLQFRSNTVNYTLSGKRLDIQLPYCFRFLRSCHISVGAESSTFVRRATEF